MSSKPQQRDGDNDHLDEEDIRRIAREETAIESPDGETHRLADLVKIPDLDKKQAYGALWLIGLGASAGSAITAVMTTEASAQATTGSGTLEIGEIIANQITSEEINVGEITGDVVGRAEPIDHLAGNIFVSDTEPASGSTGDVWLDIGGGQ